MARARRGNAPIIEYFWAEDDPAIVSQQLIGLSESLEDFHKPLLAAAELSRRDIGVRFDTATDPSGRAWEAWSETYAPFAIKHTTGRIFPDRANLHLTGEMHREVTDPSHWRVTNQDVFMDTTGLPERWAWHNFGADRATSDEFGDIANELPARPFIGMSPLTRNKIIFMFEAWFRGEVTVATSSKGAKFFRRVPRRT